MSDEKKQEDKIKKEETKETPKEELKNDESKDESKKEEKAINKKESEVIEVKDGTDIFDDETNAFDLKISDEKEVVEKDSSKKKDKKEKKTKKGKKKKKKKVMRRVVSGRAYIQATYNNTIIALTDQNGDTLVVGSAGQMGFKGPKKSTPYAAGLVVRSVVARAREFGLQSVSVFVKGVGAGRESSIRALNANGLQILAIKDQTPIPHNGCRPKKPRRV